MTPSRFTLETDTEVISLQGNVPVTQALILFHGRGASALDILQVTNAVTIPDNCLVIAPEAPGHTWYPYRFIEPQQANEPALSIALSVVANICEYLYTKHSLKSDQVTLAGFSQGACLVAEFLKRTPQRYKAAAVYSGGLIGTDKEVTTSTAGSLAGTPLYLGCDEEDFHIPKERVIETAEYFSNHEAVITLELYKNFGHAIHPHGLQFLEKHLEHI